MAKNYETKAGKPISADANSFTEYLLGLRGRIPNYGDELALSHVGTTLTIGTGAIIYTGRKALNTAQEIIEVTPEVTGTTTKYIVCTMDASTGTLDFTIEDTSAGNIEDQVEDLLANNTAVSFDLGTLENSTSGILNTQLTCKLASFVNIETLALDVDTLQTDVATLQQDVNFLLELWTDDGWVDLTYEAGYQPITPTSTLQYKIIGNFLLVRGTASPVTGEGFTDGPLVVASGVDFTGYVVTGIVQLDSLGIYGGSNGSLPFKGTVEPDGRLIVAISPSFASVGGTRSTYVAFNLVMPLDKA